MASAPPTQNRGLNSIKSLKVAIWCDFWMARTPQRKAAAVRTPVLWNYLLLRNRCDLMRKGRVCQGLWAQESFQSYVKSNLNDWLFSDIFCASISLHFKTRRWKEITLTMSLQSNVLLGDTGSSACWCRLTQTIQPNTLTAQTPLISPSAVDDGDQCHYCM